MAMKLNLNDYAKCMHHIPPKLKLLLVLKQTLKCDAKFLGVPYPKSYENHLLK